MTLSLYLNHVGHFNVTHTLDYFATLFRSPSNALHGLADAKLCYLFSGWFAKEANVANNKQRLANFMTQSQRGTGTAQMFRGRKGRQKQLGRVSGASGSHHHPIAPPLGCA
jgi:hypothetical protein